jgi:hypothetical protein
MSGREIDFIKAALAEDWATPLGPDCDAFEEELKQFVTASPKSSPEGEDLGEAVVRQRLRHWRQVLLRCIWLCTHAVLKLATRCWYRASLSARRVIR